MKFIRKRGPTSLLCLSAILWMGIFPAQSHAALTFNANATAAQMTSILNGPGLAVKNLQISQGANNQTGIVTGGTNILGFEAGVFLSTGNVGSLRGPNDTSAYSYNTGVTYVDPDLTTISSEARFDPAIIEFDIVPQGDKANFVFTFGSDEYPEYVCSQFNDAFGLFVSGPGINGTYNAARVPNSSDVIAVNNINAGKAGSKADGTKCNLNNSRYFVNNGNGGGSTITQLDGFTKTITTTVSKLTSGKTYHVKLALADAADPGYDSGAAFKWLTSTDSQPVDLKLTVNADTLTPTINKQVVLTYTVKNQSNTSTKLVMAELDWPEGMTWLSDDSGGNYDSKTHEWNVGFVPANGSKTVSITAKVGTDPTYKVTGEISFAFNEDPDSQPLNRQTNPNEDDTATITLKPMINLPPVITSDGGGDSADIKLKENTTVVTTVSATDANNDTLVYSITGGADAALFQINANTGKLLFISAPDFENPLDGDKNNVYRVIVSVSDGKLDDTQLLLVTVTDVNENVAPVITSNGGGDSATIKLEENNQVATTVTATDANDDKLVYAITGGVDKAMFQINATTGKLSFINAPDFETPLDSNKDNIYEVVVSAADPYTNDTQSLKIIILNVEDSNIPPSIINSSTGTYYENDTSIVVDFNATDNQDSEGSGLTYSFSGQVDDALFKLDSTTGILTFKASPDYENPQDANKDNAYITGAEVCDSQGACVVRVLIVTVLDVDEDNDLDGLMDSEEKVVGTNPWNKDSDGDGLGDLEEVDDPTVPMDHDKDDIIDALDPDDDNDTILTKHEMPDPNADGNHLDARDSDGDGTPDYLDSDDDNDTVLTKYEEPDHNGDGNPVPDARDTDTDGKPDYLDIDDDGDSSLTRDEHPDPNGDGNPDDAIDDDGNGIPSWLDASEDFIVTIQVRAFLNGAYNSGTGLMNNELFQKGQVPEMQPYGELKTAFGYGNSSSTVSPFDYHGAETMSTDVKTATDGNAPVDWMLIELRDSLDPTIRRGAMAAVLQRDGDIVDAVTGSSLLHVLNTSDGSYYVVVRHRNHLGVMTAAPLNLTTQPSTLIDFTHPGTRVFGGYAARLQTSTIALMWSGDTNNSNTVILSGPGSDSSVILGSVLVAPENTLVNTNYQLSGYYATDLNMDGYVVFTGPGNEINLLVGTVLLHPDNTTGNANFIVNGTVPR